MGTTWLRLGRVVGGVRNPARNTLFTARERRLLCSQSVGEELPAAVARANGCGFMLRRMPLAYQYQAEDESRQVSHDLEPCVRFVYLPPDPEYRDTTFGLVLTEGW